MFDLNRDGQYSNVSDAVVFLAHVHAIDDIINKVDLQAEVTWANKTTSIATVVKVRRLDGTVWLKWL